MIRVAHWRRRVSERLTAREMAAPVERTPRICALVWRESGRMPGRENNCIRLIDMNSSAFALSHNQKGQRERKHILKSPSMIFSRVN